MNFWRGIDDGPPKKEAGDEKREVLEIVDKTVTESRLEGARIMPTPKIDHIEG